MSSPKTSWRETTSEQAQADLDGLLDTSLQMAEEALAKDEGFIPFGVAVDEDGDYTVMATEDAEDADDALAGLLNAAADMTGDHRAFAFVAEVQYEEVPSLDGPRASSAGEGIPQEDDKGPDHVVRVELEHSEGVAIAVSAVYARKRRKVKQTELRAATGLPHVFTG